MKKVGFLVNPKSGYGIQLNRPGSDLIEDYDPEKSKAAIIAGEFIREFKNVDVHFLTAAGYMGAGVLKSAGVQSVDVIHTPSSIPERADTLSFISELNRHEPDLLIFFGGDGTAVDIYSALAEDIPVIGIPSGVKMHSSVFAITAEHGHSIFRDWLSGAMDYGMADVVDADEKAMMEGINVFEVKGALLVPKSNHMLLTSKREYESTDIMGAVEYIIEKMEKDVSYIIGSGSTCKAIVSELGFKTPFYGNDVVLNGKLVAENADSKFLSEYSAGNRTCLILTPIGGQGFLVGRGNRQIDDSVLRNINAEDITVIASAEKIRDLKGLIVDSGIWRKEWLKVMYDYGRFRMMKVLK